MTVKTSLTIMYYCNYNCKSLYCEKTIEEKPPDQNET